MPQYECNQLGTVPTVSVRTTVPAQIDSINDELLALMEAVNRIGERTISVSDSPPPETVANGQTASCEPPVIEYLDTVIQRLRLATIRLHGISDRIRL